jgi:hypothetical protein
MFRDEDVERVEKPRDMHGSGDACERAGQRDLVEESDRAAAVAGDRCPVSTHEPPAVVARVLGHAREKPRCVVVGEREQGQLVAPVELGDDPRRPTTELSGAGVEQYRAMQCCGRQLGGAFRDRHRETRYGLTLKSSRASLNI